MLDAADTNHICIVMQMFGAAERDGCATRMVDADEAARLADVFKLLGDTTRTRLLGALLEAGELCVCDLADAAAVPESTASHALRLLRTAGIVRNRRAGRQVFYSLADAHVRLLLDVSLEHLRHGDDR